MAGVCVYILCVSVRVCALTLHVNGAPHESGGGGGGFSARELDGAALEVQHGQGRAAEKHQLQRRARSVRVHLRYSCRGADLLFFHLTKVDTFFKVQNEVPTVASLETSQ